MSIPGPLDVPTRLLLGPGPSDAHPRVLTAMANPLLGHLDPKFLEIMADTSAMLRDAYQTTNNLTFPISATGMAGMETCLVNLLEPGDRMIVCFAGYFSQRMIDVAGRCGAEVIVLTKPWGEFFSLDELVEAVKKHKPKALGIVHAETSTGVHQPLEGLGAVCHANDCLLVVDAVTSLGCVPLHVDKWEIDAIYSCSQKGLSCPPGLSPVSFSPRAEEVMGKRKTKVQSWYLDLTMIRQYWGGGDRAYHHTAPITMNYALREGLRLLLEEGLEARWARHAKHHAALKAGLNALGLEYIAPEGYQLPQLNAVKIPTGLEDLPIRKKMLNDFGIEIGGGLGDFKGKAWRIGLMGYNARASCVQLALAALGQVMRSFGHSKPAGLGVEAAEAVYAKQG
jgi:alanine-glyoxylate transaminase / serine-glyoxylate transaminase / serine-pyruvate transaminase